MRLFVAFAIPDAIARSLAHAARTTLLLSPQSRVRWTEPRDMHVTLVFLGQVEDRRIPDIEQALSGIDAKPFTVGLGDCGVFPRAGVLYASILKSPGLVRLVSLVQEAMEEAGFPREARPYTPHVTLARTREKLAQESLRAGTFDQETIPVSEFHLYQSHLSPQGARYEVLATYPLHA